MLEELGFDEAGGKNLRRFRSSVSEGCQHQSNPKGRLVFHADSPGYRLLPVARSRTNRQFLDGAAYLRWVEENAATPFHVRN